jgi:hypothetical protein
LSGHRKHRADCDDARASDARNENAFRMTERIARRLGQRFKVGSVFRNTRLRKRAVHCHKGRAEAFEAGKILVAARLVDRALTPELRFQRLHRHAVRLHAAIAASLADEAVDDDTPVGVRIETALTAASLLRRAGLIVDEDCQPFDRPQFLLHRR